MVVGAIVGGVAFSDMVVSFALAILLELVVSVMLSELVLVALLRLVAVVHAV